MNTFYLEVLRGPDRGKVIALDEEVSIIGRSKQCDIVLSDETISRQHIELAYTAEAPGSLRLKDLNSRNGVYINQKKETQRMIFPGDYISIGDSIMVVRLNENEDQGLPPAAQENFDMQEQDTEDRLVASIGVEQVNLSQLNLSQVEAIVIQKRLQTLYRVSEIITMTVPLREKLKLLLDTIFEVIPAETGFIAINNNDTGIIEPVVSIPARGSGKTQPIKVSWTIINKCIEDKSGVLASDATKDERFDLADSIVNQKIRSVLAVPLFFQDRLFGVIFHYLFSTKGSEGTGIGLFVSKKIVENHGGTLTVESDINKGTRFIIRIHCTEDNNTCV